MFGLCCCQSSTGCHIRQVVIYKIKDGFTRLDGVVDRRRWLIGTLTIFSDTPQVGVTTYNRYSSVPVSTGGGAAIPPNANISSVTATSMTGTLVGLPVTQFQLELTSEYTDDMVFADAKNMLMIYSNTTDPIHAFDGIPIDQSWSLNYNLSGAVIGTINNPGIIGPVTCLIPTPGYILPVVGVQSAHSEWQSVNISGLGAVIQMQIIWTRFYDPASPGICTYTYYTQEGSIAPPASACAVPAPIGQDPTYGTCWDIGPVAPWYPADDYVNYGAPNVEFINPYNQNITPLSAFNNFAPWTCNCYTPS